MRREPLLEVKDLKKSYGRKPILRGVSFSVFPGEIVGILGHNGAGKTTAFYITIGLLHPDQGDIYFHGNAITHVPVHKRAKMGIGYLAQEPSIFRSLTVAENIQLALEVQELSQEEKEKILKTQLEEMNLKHLAKTKAELLSGGEKRRVEIARTLALNPSLVLLDEPFANIDPKTISDVKRMIRMLKAKNISVLITDHNAREIFTLVDRSYLIAGGETLASGTSAELLESDLVRISYLGSDFSL